MSFVSKKAPLELTEEERTVLLKTIEATTADADRVERASIMLAFADGETLYSIARRLGTYCMKASRCIEDARKLGPLAALEVKPNPILPKEELFVAKRAPLILTEGARAELSRITEDRTETVDRIERASIILAFADGEGVSSIARRLGTNRTKVGRWVDNAIKLGPLGALAVRPGRRPAPGSEKDNPFVSKKPPLVLTENTRTKLLKITKARTEAAHRIERATIILAFANGETVSGIARRLATNEVKVETSIDRALELGAMESLEDRPRRGREPTITAEARAWLISMACSKAKDHGYAQEFWTTQLLANHAHQHCVAAGHPSLANISKGTVSKILRANDLRPHKTAYYLERRDPDIDAKMAAILCLYHTVALRHL